MMNAEILCLFPHLFILYTVLFYHFACTSKYSYCGERVILTEKAFLGNGNGDVNFR